MENENNNNKILKTLCCELPLGRQWIWLYTFVQSTLSSLLHILSLLADLIVAFRLVWTHHMLATGLVTFFLIYVPVVFTLILKPPKAPKYLTCTSAIVWILKSLIYMITLPLVTSVRLLNRVLWAIKVIHNKKPNEEILHEFATILPKEAQSYLFLQAFLHSCPQAVLQIHLLLLQVTSNKYTEYFQIISLVTAVISVAVCVSSFHRYEAQVMGGRPAVLLFNSPDLPETSLSLLSTNSNLPQEVISLERDSFPGKVVLFFSWFFLIHSRMLCLVIAYEVYPLTTLIIIAVQCFLVLIYLIVSQPTTFSNIHSKLLNAAISNFTLIEVSVRFHKVTLLYIMFFISLVSEDTVLTVLFFIYSSDICSRGILRCDHFGMYTYIIMNSHVIGVILFIIYLSHFAPAGKPVNANTSTSSLAL